MKALGNYSLASFIRFIISAAWYIQLLFLVLLTCVDGIKFFRYGSYGTNTVATTLDVRITRSRTENITTVPGAKKIEPSTLMLDSGKLIFSHPGNKLLLGFNLLSLWTTFAISLSITYLLRQVFRSLAQNNPFVLENARRLRVIAILIMLISITTLAHDATVNWFLQQNFLINNIYGAIRAPMVIDVKTLFAGLIVLVIAEIFRIGAHMKEEQELTV